MRQVLACASLCTAQGPVCAPSGPPATLLNCINLTHVRAYAHAQSTLGGGGQRHQQQLLLQQRAKRQEWHSRERFGSGPSASFVGPPKRGVGACVGETEQPSSPARLSAEPARAARAAGAGSGAQQQAPGDSPGRPREPRQGAMRGFTAAAQAGVRQLGRFGWVGLGQTARTADGTRSDSVHTRLGEAPTAGASAGGYEEVCRRGRTRLEARARARPGRCPGA